MNQIKEYCYDCNTYHWGPICRCISKPINRNRLDDAMIALQIKYETKLWETLNEQLDNARFKSTGSSKSIK